MFVEALVNYVDPKRYIWLETDVSGNAIGGILGQLTLDDLGWWNLVVYFSQKMIPAEIWYKTHDGKLLIIVEVFKTWKYYLEGCKYEVFMLTDHHNLQRFMDKKNLSFTQVWFVQKLSRYYFSIHYQQGMELLMPCYNTPTRLLRKKKLFELRIQRSCIDCNLCWHKSQS